jgi:hypothetical protein
MLPPRYMARIWKIVSYVCFVISAIGMAADFNFSTSYSRANPTSPDARSGRIYPHNERGRVVFLNRDELVTVQLSEGATYLGIVGFLVAGSLGGLFRGKK